MKILKIFGVVVGIHVFALMLIFANPGCSSTNKPPSPAETVQNDGEGAANHDEAATAISSPDVAASEPSAITVAPENTPPAGVSYPPPPTVRFSPTRPGTAAANALEVQPVTGVTPASTYTVKPGDSLWTIAHKNHISVAELAVANNIKQNAIVRIGQKLLVPAKSAPVSTSAAESVQAAPAQSAPKPKPSAEPVKHVVKPGETLGGIARKYGVKLGDIAAVNAIADPAKIRPGQELTIPGWRAPAGKSAASTSASTATPSSDRAASPPPAATTPEEVPTVVLPAPEQDLDSGLTPTNSEPPVIQVEEKK
jgi:LysM repeat protein